MIQRRAFFIPLIAAAFVILMGVGALVGLIWWAAS